MYRTFSMRSPTLTWIVSPSTIRTTVPSRAAADAAGVARSRRGRRSGQRRCATPPRCHPEWPGVNKWIPDELAHDRGRDSIQRQRPGGRPRRAIARRGVWGAMSGSPNKRNSVYPEHRVAERSELAVDERLLAPVGGSAVDDDVPVGPGQGALPRLPAVMMTPPVQEDLDVFLGGKLARKVLAKACLVA